MQFDGVKSYLNITSKEQKGLNSLFFWKIISFLVSSSIFIAITSSLATYFSFLLLNTEINLKLLLAIFFIMFTVYSLNKLTDREEDLVNLPERTSYIQGNEQLLLLLSIFSCFIAILLGFSVNFLTIFVLLFPFVVGIFYSIRIHPKIPRLKDITGIKSFSVAISWAVIASFIPAICSQNIDKGVLLIFYFIFIKLFVNTVLFDVRDIKGDKKNNIKTIPVAIGRAKTKMLLFVIHLSLIPWLVIAMCWDLFTRYLLVLIFCIIYGFWYINYFCSNEVPIFALDLFVDGEWLIVAVLCVVIYFISE